MLGQTSRTSPDVRVLAEKRREVLPLRGITVYWPTLAQLRYSETVENVLLAASDVRVELRLRVSWRGHVVDGMCLIGKPCWILQVWLKTVGSVEDRRNVDENCKLRAPGSTGTCTVLSR